MTVALVRDLSIILLAMLGVLLLVSGSIVAWLTYRKVSPILDSTKETMKQAQEVSTMVSEKLVKPMIGKSAPAFSAGRVVAFLIGLSKGKGGSKDGK